jgi:bacterioferritin (cytochrome b1)
MGDMDGDSRRILEQIRSDDEKHAEMLRSEVEKLVRQNGLR